MPHLNGGLFLLRGNIQQYRIMELFLPAPIRLFSHAGFFPVCGASLFAGRLVSVIFSFFQSLPFLNSLNACTAPKLRCSPPRFWVMPGFFWLASVAMIETTLIFFFTVAPVFFFWLKEHKNKFLVLSALAFVLGVFTKYQTVIVAAIAVAALAFLGRDYLLKKFRTIPD